MYTYKIIVLVIADGELSEKAQLFATMAIVARIGVQSAIA